MQIEALSCNNCGAPLEVPETANFATCAHCGSRLAIRRTESAHYTEVLDELSKRTDRISDELEELQVRNELLELEQSWDNERRQYMVRTRDGSLVEPDMGQIAPGIFALAVVLVGGCLLLGMIGSSPLAGEFIWVIVPFMLITLGIAGWTVFDNFRKHDQYSNAAEAYLARKAEIEGRLRKIEQAGG